MQTQRLGFAMGALGRRTLLACAAAALLAAACVQVSAKPEPGTAQGSDHARAAHHEARLAAHRPAHARTGYAYDLRAPAGPYAPFYVSPAPCPWLGCAGYLVIGTGF
jgi:hypothetical protein